jgi:hypothetical protein
MISTSQKEHLTYTAMGQIITLSILWLIAFQYIIPWLAQIDAAKARAASAIDKYAQTEQDGLTLPELTKALEWISWKEELLKIINSAPAETMMAIKKSWSDKYLTWLNDAMVKSGDDKNKLIQAKQKLNSILPTLSPISNNFDEENITLKEYVKYIEWILIKKYGINENMMLGLQSVSYGDVSWNTPKNIWSFSLSIDFEWTNWSIQKLIEYLNESWNGEILNNTGKLSQDQIPPIMSNPLITIESFALDKSFDINKPNDKNAWRAMIKFYVRGGSTEDLKFLQDAISTRKTEFQNKVKIALEKCKSLCSQKTRLEEFQNKVNSVFDAMSNWWKGWKTTQSLEILVQNVRSIYSLQQEYDEFNNDLVTTK